MVQTLILFALSMFALSIASAKNEAKDSIPHEVELRVRESDIKIVRRASEILSKPSSWNKKDNRECPEKARTFSLYCALHKASVDINGEYDHRLTALEEVRRVIEDVAKSKDYEHRLMGYNNDPTTSFADIQRILRTTEVRLLARFPK